MTSDVEYPLKRGPARELHYWVSAWADLLQVRLMLHGALDLSKQRTAWESITSRRALIDTALIAYGRLFNSGARAGLVDLHPWVDELGAQGVALHDEVIRWRNVALAHRDSSTLEDLEMSVVWGPFGERPGLRMRLTSVPGPDDDLALDLMTMCELFGRWVWERELWSRQEAWLLALGERSLQGMLEKARVHLDAPLIGDSLLITQTVGGDKPPESAPYTAMPSGRVRP